MCCKDKNHDINCSLDMGRGCMFCNCQTEPSVKVCEGCFKLHETDWLDRMPEMFPSDIIEVRFKNTRRSYYQNVNDLELKRGDIVAVESSPGHDIGIVSLTGDMVARQMKRVGFNPLNGEFKKIYRKAKPYDIEKWQEAIAMEHETMIRSRQIAADMGLNMKIGDVEFQGDKIKAIFYYIADERVDFRELIKVFAEQFRIRVEMKQIGARQEAGRIGGLGSCGRELCCASWISSFVSVTTNSARAQEISLNPQKLAGQCSKLKCCLVYELDDYLDARREFPRINEPLHALDGDYYLVKTDILRRTMSFSTSQNALVGMVTLPLARVKDILDLNRRGKKVDTLEGDVPKPKKSQEPGFSDVLGSESITRFDEEKAERQRSKRQSRRGGERRKDDAPKDGRDDPRRDERKQQQDNRPRDDKQREPAQRKEQRGTNERRDMRRQENRQENRQTDRSKPGRGGKENQGGEENTKQQRPQRRNTVSGDNSPVGGEKQETNRGGGGGNRMVNRNSRNRKPAPKPKPKDHNE